MDGNATKLDKWGHAVNTRSNECMSAINRYYDQVLNYGREKRVILKAADHDGYCVLANILAAHFLALSDPPKSRAHAIAASSRLEEATPYEKAVFYSIAALLSPDRDDDAAFELHSKLLDEYPKDLLSAKRAQLFCFYTGRPDLSLILIEKILSVNQHEAYIHSMHAFPLLELGRNEEALIAAERAYSIKENDTWAQHCLCHVYQNKCNFKKAIEFMENCSPQWTAHSSFLCTHNWWHVAMCHLERCRSSPKAIQIYDKHIWRELEKEDAAPAEVYINALALLFRLFVRGAIEASNPRLIALAKRVSDKSLWHLEHHFDTYVIWALSQAGGDRSAEEMLSSFKARISSLSEIKQFRMKKPLQLAEAVYAYGKRNYAGAYQLLGPNFNATDYKMIGASDEQVDVFNEMWYMILLNTGRASLVIRALEKEVKKRNIPFLWVLLAKGYTMIGSQEAVLASAKAGELEAAYSD